VAENTPIQPCYATDCTGQVEIYPQYAEGLRDLEGYSHVYLLFYLHQAKKMQLLVKPFLQDVERGVFATRAPCRPNPIGMSIVRLLAREKNILHIAGVDILDQSPLLDIKPYSHRFDCIENTRNGWQDEVDEDDASVRGRRGYQPRGQGASKI
jgi:tRNA-Thr(GGU) m(6)t(6)A37 methyltransferase TsaA